MVLQSMVSGLVEAALPFAPNHDKQEMLFDWIPVKTWKNCSDGTLFDDTSCSFSVPKSNWIHKRRKIEIKSDASGLVDQEIDEAIVDVFQDDPSHANIMDKIDAGSRAPINRPQYTSSKPGSCSASRAEGICSGNISTTCSEGVHRTKVESEVCTMTDSLDLELEMDNDCSTRDICISFLKSHGLLEGDWCKHSNALTEVGGSLDEGNFFQKCELCGTLDDTTKMLLCDHCDKAFHISCCNSKAKTLPGDEWFCQLCSKLSFKALPENFFLKSSTISRWNGVPKYKLGPIARMLKYPEPYVSRVRIGECHQVEVPECSSQIAKDIDCIGEPLELNPEETLNFHGLFKDKFPRCDSISNWLQCREVMADQARSGRASICGKWRRAPISEVQKDDWDCSCAVVWDPLHSDCAVPQEVETDQVLLQLKYVERLRARLAARNP